MATPLVAVESVSLVQSIGTLSIALPASFVAGACVGAIVVGGVIYYVSKRE